jgi:transcriptional regulator with XRE-family HTH domain
MKAKHYTTLTKIESGVIKTPSVLMVEKIAKALGVSIEDLL